MEVIILSESAAVGRLAGSIVADTVRDRPAAVLGLATGSSPLSLYSDLARRVRIGEIDFTQARAFALDEYIGLPPTHHESYAQVINREVVQPLGFNSTDVRVPDGMAADLQRAAQQYELDISAAGGIDVQILGIGVNGHIGFNEPTSSFSSRTRVKTLAPSTREANARFFESVDHVPTHCLTQGLGTILEARRIVLVAHGSSKAEAIAAAVEGPLSALVPASALQLHEHATVIVDERAAAKLDLQEYYQYVWMHKSVESTQRR